MILAEPCGGCSGAAAIEVARMALLWSEASLQVFEYIGQQMNKVSGSIENINPLMSHDA